MTASFPRVTVLIFLDVLFTEYLTMAASFPRVTVLIFLEVLFSGMYSVNYMD